QVVLQLRALNSPACTPNRPDSSATVPSSRTAANATFALNSGLCFLRVLAMSHLRPTGRSRGRLSLSNLSSFRGPPQLIGRGRRMISLFDLGAVPSLPRQLERGLEEVHEQPQ